MLKFEGICVDIGNKKILRDVSGSANPWETLAVMGPTGSGKSTLLNSIAGYLPITKGTITLDGKKIDKSNRRTMSYVLQADIFFEQLTLRETLLYTAQLRLPYSWGFKAKKEKVNELISMLGLEDCEHTIVGGLLRKGLSGGEKKRLNIACELIANPTILLLDEPTSGLDSSSAYSLCMNLKKLAHSEGKTIVTSIHQPSSQIFYSFDKVLLIAKGKVAYYGPAKSVMDHFSSMGLNGPEVHNPADFILDLVTDSKTRQMLIGKDQDEDSHGKWTFKLFVSPLYIFKQLRKKFRDKSTRKENHVVLESGRSSTPPKMNHYPSTTESSSNHQEVNPTSALKRISNKTSTNDKPILLWLWQFLVLIRRSSRLSWRRVIGPLALFQTIGILVSCCMMWYQVPLVEEAIMDRNALLYYVPGSYSFLTAALVISSFPVDWVVVVKERAGGYYHLSAYFLAKITVDYFFAILHPTIFIIPLFPIAGLQGFVPFLETWGLFVLHCLANAAFSIFLGAVFLNTGRAFVVNIVVNIPMFVLGGFFIRKPTPLVKVLTYMSILRYTLHPIMQVNNGPEVGYLCAEKSQYDVCLAANATSLNSTYISGPEVVKKLGYTEPILLCVGVITLVAVTFTVLTYLTLKCLHGRQKPQ